MFVYLSRAEYLFLNSKFGQSKDNPARKVALITSIYCISFIPRIGTNLMAAFFSSKMEKL
jgi:hypothetical protein